MSTPRAVVERFLTIFSSGDVHAILDMLTEDASWWVAGHIEGISGSNGKQELGRLLLQVAPLYTEGRLPITPVSMIAEGSFVACEARSRSDLIDGRTYANEYHFLFEVAGEKIRQVREYSDTQHMVETFKEG